MTVVVLHYIYEYGIVLLASAVCASGVGVSVGVGGLGGAGARRVAVREGALMPAAYADS